MKILVCMRQLPYAEPTVRFGAMIADLEDSQITLMTVIDDEAERPDAELELDRARALVQGSKVETKLRRGTPVAEILDEAREYRYDIVAVGTRDAAGLIDALLGTVSDRIADQASASVLVVKEARPRLNRVLIPIGGARMNPTVVQVGTRLAKSASAEVTVLYVANPVPTMYTGLEAIEETLPELLQTDTPIARHLRWSARYLSEQRVQAGVKVRHGVAADEIMREAMQGDYDLVVIGARTLGRAVRRFLIDQVTPHVVGRAVRSVLVVR